MHSPGAGKIRYFDTAEFGRVGFVICFDADYPSYLHQVSALGIDLLVQSSMTYGPLRYVHAGMAKIRAVEQGAAVLRCCDEGVSGLYDPYYRTLQEEETFSAAHKSSMAVWWSKQPKAWTCYGAFGDLLSWACCSFALVILGLLGLPESLLASPHLAGDVRPQR